MLLQAVLDALDDDDPTLAAPARRWLPSAGVEWVEAMDMPAERVANFLTGLEPLDWEQLSSFR